MAGSILGKDQIEKIDMSYRRIYVHIKELLASSPTPTDLMRVHVLTEYLDTTELSKIFMKLPFLSPAEKRALVRTAIFDVLLQQDHRIPITLGEDIPKSANQTSNELKTFQPPQFNLNVAKASDVKVVESNVAPKPVEKIPAVLTKLNDLREDAKEKHDVAEAERHEAAAKIHETQGESEITTGFKMNIATVKDHQGK